MSALDVATLRELFRNLALFRSVYESDGVTSVWCPGGYEITIWDLEYLYENLCLLTPRQREAIEFCLVQNMRERDAAARMGVSPTNPVAMYASSGLQKLIGMIQAGELPRFREEGEMADASGF